MKRSAMAAITGLVPWLLVGPPPLALAHGVLLESRPVARETVAVASRLDLRLYSYSTSGPADAANIRIAITDPVRKQAYEFTK